jgi:very-short-patch-repair endonuclease
MNATPLGPRRKHFEAPPTAVDNFEDEKRRSQSIGVIAILNVDVVRSERHTVLPPPLRGRVGEGGMTHAHISRSHRARARSLRRGMTRAETLLWRQLNAHRLGDVSFRRQAPMGPYTADLVSHALRLVIELDGGSHDILSRQQADMRRDAWFAGRGYRVLRFTNDDVLKNPEGVVLAIAEAAQTPPSLSLPRKGGGDPQTDSGV